MSRQPTKAERQYMDNVRELNCIVCRNEGLGMTPAAIHHTDGHTKPDAHLKVLPLCYFHHQGEYGTGLHSGRVEWERKFGTQAELLKQVERLLE